MSFSANEATLAFLIKIEIPAGDILYTEGGEVTFGGDTYAPSDSVFGAITGFENFTSGLSDAAPEYDLEWTPPSTAAAVTLADPANQGALCSAYVVTINRASGAVLTDKTVFTGILDSATLEIQPRARVLKMTQSTEIDRFLNTNKGNRLNAAWHKSIYPGETGLDMTTGTTIPVPWGDKLNTRQGGGGNPNTDPGTDPRNLHLY